MKYRRMGSSGLTLSEIAFGCGGNAGLMVRGSLSEQVHAMGAADAHPAIPLGLHGHLGVFAEGGGFAGHDDHRQFRLGGAQHRHGAMHEAHARMDHHRLRTARDGRVAHGHVHREGLVPAIDEGGASGALDLLPRHGLPDGAPFRAGGGEDIINIEIAQGLDNSLAAVVIILHLRSPSDLPSCGRGIRAIWGRKATLGARVVAPGG